VVVSQRRPLRTDDRTVVVKERECAVADFVSELSTQRSSSRTKRISAEDLVLVRKYMTLTYEKKKEEFLAREGGMSLDDFIEEKIETFKDIAMPGDWLWENEFKWQWLTRDLCDGNQTTDVLTFFS